MWRTSTNTRPLVLPNQNGIFISFMRGCWKVLHQTKKGMTENNFNLNDMPSMVFVSARIIKCSNFGNKAISSSSLNLIRVCEKGKSSVVPLSSLYFLKEEITTGWLLNMFPIFIHLFIWWLSMKSERQQNSSSL